MLLGKSWAVEIHGCNRETISLVEQVEGVILDACASAGLAVVKSMFHQFSPHGVSGCAVVSESHVCIHTWPEYAHASVDIYLCGDSAPLAIRVFNEIARALRGSVLSVRCANRATAQRWDAKNLKKDLTKQHSYPILIDMISTQPHGSKKMEEEITAMSADQLYNWICANNEVDGEEYFQRLPVEPDYNHAEDDNPAFSMYEDYRLELQGMALELLEQLAL